MIIQLSNFFTGTIFKQTILSSCVSMSYFCIGLVRGYSASAVPSINELNPDLLPNKEIASWASSIPPFGAFFGSIVAGPLLHYYGRKRTVLITAPIWMLSWTIIALSSIWWQIVIGRMLSGFAAGLTLPAAQIYVTECSDPKIRGVIGSFPAIFMSAGILISYIIGYFWPWNYLAWSSAVFAVLQLIMIIILPESPVWYKSKNKLSKADMSYEWLKLPKMTQSEIDEKRTSDPWKIFLTRPILLPLAVGLTLLMIQQLSGIDAIIFFTVDIFRQSGSSIDGNLATIMVGLVQLASNILSLFVVDRAGRKPLLIISGVIMGLSTASMGMAFYLAESGNHNFGFLPLCSLIVFMIGYSLGFGCIPFLLMGEIFPTKQRSVLSSIAGSFNLGAMFVVIKTYHPLQVALTTAGTFWLYSSLCIFGVIFVVFFVPETKGRDLENIASLFAKREKGIEINKTNGKHDIEDTHL